MRMNPSERNLLKSAVVYRVYPKSFFDSDGDGIGDLEGVKQKLSYFRTLGADIIALSSLFESNYDFVGYGATNFCRVNPALGTQEDFDRLIEDAHEKGLRLFLCLSLFSTSAQHEWFEKSRVPSEMNPYREYYIRRKGKNARGTTPPDDRKNYWGDTAWSYDKSSGDWCLNEYGKDFPVLNYDNPRVRKEILDVLRFWLGKGVDGFLFDRVHFGETYSLPIDKTSSSKEDFFESGAALCRILTEAKEKIEESFPVIITVDREDPEFLRTLLVKNGGLADSLCIEAPISPLSLNRKCAFSQKKFLSDFSATQAEPEDLNLSFEFENPTQQRVLALFETDFDRSAAAAKFLATLHLTARTTPILFQGAELGMTNSSGKKIRENALFEQAGDTSCSPFPWDNTANAGFSELTPYLRVDANYHKINVAAEAADPESVLSFYHKLIAFRKESSALLEGDFKDCSRGDFLLYLRASESERFLIMANASSRPANYSLPEELRSEVGVCEISNYSLVTKSIHSTIGLRAYEVRIYRLKKPLLALS